MRSLLRTILPASMLTILPLITAPAVAGSSPPVDDAVVKRALEDEMARSLSQLKLGSEAPPYYLRYTIVDTDRTWVSARLGELVEEGAEPSRNMYTEVRVGTPDEDNTNFAGSSPGGAASVSRDDIYAVLRRDLWQLTDSEYKDALEAFARKRASKAIESAGKDKVPDFSKAPPLKLTTNKASPPSAADITKIRETTLKLSAIFREFPKVDSGRAFAGTTLTRRRLLTSEKTWTDEQHSNVRIDVTADTVADDGEHLGASLSFSGSDVSALPPFEKMEAEVRALAKNLEAQRTAPHVDPGVASVLFEGEAAAQLARLLFVAPSSGQPVPRSPGHSFPTDGSSSFAERVGLVVAPKWLRVIDDPTATGPNKKPLVGSYDSDDEGVAAERVTIIDHGVVKSLLMGRTPRKEFPKSNGHGRGLGGVRASASNILVTAHTSMTRPALIAAAQRSAGPRGSVFIVRQLSDSSGVSRGQPLVANVAVKLVDGKETPVRGLSLEGFVLKKMKKDLIGAGKDVNVLEHYGVGVLSPSLLFEDVDIGKPNDKNRTPPLYPSPLSGH